jgi:hypothetical protein
MKTGLAPCVRLTPIGVTEADDVSVGISQFIAYSQNEGFTRLRLIGGRTLDVKESTDRIDYLIRLATSAARV